MTILTLYILRTIAAPTFLVTLALMAITSIMALVDELAIAETYDYGAGIALQFVLLSLPNSIYQLSPTIMLIGSLLGLGVLASSSELIVMRASGISLMRLGFAAAISGAVFAVLAFIMGDLLVPKSHKIAFDLRSESRYGGTRVGEGGAWFREDNRYIFIEEIFSSEQLGKVHIYGFNDRYHLTGALAAERAMFKDQRWQLEAVRMSTLENEEVDISLYPKMDWQVTVSPEILQLSIVRADSLTTAGLWRYAEYLSSNNLDASEYWTELWRKLAMPITIIVMSLIAVPFVSGSRRSGGAGQRLFVGILLGIGFFLLNEIVGSSGQVYGLAPYVTTLLPTVIVLVAAVAWLKRFS